MNFVEAYTAMWMKKKVIARSKWELEKVLKIHVFFTDEGKEIRFCAKYHLQERNNNWFYLYGKQYHFSYIDYIATDWEVYTGTKEAMTEYLEAYSV